MQQLVSCEFLNLEVVVSSETPVDATSEYGKLFMEDADLYNRLLLGTLLPDFMWTPLPRFFQTWLRNYIGGLLLYFLSAFLWCFFIYHVKRNVYVPSEAIPSRKTMVLQIYISMKALPWYCLLPTIFEYLAETGWTKCFPRLNNIGMLAYLIHLAIYQIFVEFGTYWAHRELHDIKPLYKYLHATHHIYNKQNTLSPFAGLAFHPLDGIIQALPQYLPLFVIPVHLTTHLVAVFIEAFWTANIHDCIHANLWPVMGAGYHTIHHTTYRHNYGHYTIWMDWMFGTLSHPKDDEGKVM